MNDNPYELPRTIDADRLIDIPQAAPLIRLRYFVLGMLVLLAGYHVTNYGYDQPRLCLAPNLLIAAALFALINPTQPLVDGPVRSDLAE